MKTANRSWTTALVLMAGCSNAPARDPAGRGADAEAAPPASAMAAPAVPAIDASTAPADRPRPGDGATPADMRPAPDVVAAPAPADATRPPPPGGCPRAAPFDDADPALEACTRPVLVFVGNAQRRTVSYDGDTWAIDQSFPDGGADQNENSHRDVAVARGVIVIVGDGGILTSWDGGATFTQTDKARHHRSAVGVFRGEFWVLSGLGTFASADGRTWRPAGTAFAAVAAVAAGDRLVAVGGSGNVRAYDGAAWSDAAIPGAASLSTLAWGGGRLVTVGDGCCGTQPGAGLRATSADGRAWTVASNASAGTDFRFGQVIWDGVRFVASGSQYDARTYASADGGAWVATRADHGVGALVRFDGTYVGAGAGIIYRSSDAAHWTRTYAGARPYGLVRGATGRVLRP